MENRSLAISPEFPKAPPKSRRQRAVEPRPAREAAPALPIRIPRGLLLGFYAIIPVALLAAFVDLGVFGGKLRASIPYSPDELLAFAVFFNLPHIVASSLGFVDADYLKHYGARISVPVAVLIASALLVPQVFEHPVFSAILYLWTVIHVIGQQFGMIRLMLQGPAPGTLLNLWKWTGIVLGAAVYIGTYVSGKDIGQTDEWLRQVTLVTGTVLAIPFGLLAWSVYRQVQSGMGKSAILANAAMIVSILILYWANYSFFLILIPRVIHDLSAFTFYIAHDLNRNNRPGRQAPNLIYRALGTIGAPARALGPLAAIAIAFPLTYFYLHDSYWAYRIAVSLTLLHYYTDRFVWKNGSPQRRFIALA